MKSFKRFLVALLSVTMILGLMPGFTFAETAVTMDGTGYESIQAAVDAITDDAEHTIYVNADQVLTEGVLIENKNVVITTDKAEGVTIEKAADESNMFGISGSTLTVTGAVTITGPSEANGKMRIFGVGYNLTSGATAATLNLYSGVTIKDHTGATGACALVGGGSTLNLDGAVITGMQAAGNGGAIQAANNATVNIKSGYIYNCASTTAAGGAINVAAGTVNITGGEIYNNTAKTYGGAVSGSSTGTITITGGKIYNNKAAYGGAFGFGGASKLSIKNAEVYGNETTSTHGGAIWSNKTPTITLGEGTKIHDNKTTGSGHGGAVCLFGGTLTVDGAEIYNNIALGNGGAIQATYTGSQKSTVTIKSGKIYNNTAVYGGGICIAGTATVQPVVTMTGGEIYDNYATGAANGRDVHISGNQVFTMTGGEIKNATSTATKNIVVGGTLNLGGSAYNQNILLAAGKTVALTSALTTENVMSIAFNAALENDLAALTGTVEGNTDKFAVEGAQIQDDGTIILLPTIDSASVSVGESIALHFYVSANGNEGLTAKFIADGKQTAAEISGSAEGVDEYVFDSLNPATIDKEITFVLYDAEGAELAEVTCSVADYCEALKDYGEGEFAAVAADLLVYANAAREYIGISTVELPAWAELVKTEGTKPESAATREITIARTDLANYIAAAGLSLASQDRLYFDIVCADKEAVIVTLTDEDDNELFTGYYDDLAAEDGRVVDTAKGFKVYTDAFGPAAYGDTYTLTLYNDGGEEINQVKYSPAAYICAKWGDGTTAISKLCRALIAFVDVAAPYAK